MMAMVIIVMADAHVAAAMRAGYAAQDLRQRSKGHRLDAAGSTEQDDRHFCLLFYVRPRYS